MASLYEMTKEVECLYSMLQNDEIDEETPEKDVASYGRRRHQTMADLFFWILCLFVLWLFDDETGRR